MECQKQTTMRNLVSTRLLQASLMMPQISMTVTYFRLLNHSNQLLNTHSDFTFSKLRNKATNDVWMLADYGGVRKYEFKFTGKTFFSSWLSVARLACCRFGSLSLVLSLSLTRFDSIHQAKWDNFYVLLWSPQLVVLFPHFHSAKPCSNIGLSVTVLPRLHFCNAMKRVKSGKRHFVRTQTFRQPNHYRKKPCD